MQVGGPVLLVLLVICQSGFSKYEPNWASLDARPLPGWYDDVKFGIFIHWGVFSVPSYGSEWFWWNWQGAKNRDYIEFMQQNYPPDFTYADFAPMFKAELFDPDQWAEIFEASGAKYIVMVSKHHEGFTNWPSQVSWNWNSMDVGPHKDLVGELSSAIRSKSKDIHFGIYHSMFEWFHPLYLRDKANKFQTQDFVKTKTMPELMELVNAYKPDVIWSDGDWEAPDTYWNSTGFLAWLYNDSPVKDTVVTNDRWGSGISCHHGGYYTCSDRYNPGKLQPHKWENCMTIDKSSWGYVRKSQLEDYLSIENLVGQLAETVSCGGNLLMNVGPTHDGRLMPIFEERLRQMGSWLSVNGDAIYSTKPWMHQNDTMTHNVWYTSKKSMSGGTDVFAIALDWPRGGMLTLGAPVVSSSTKITLMGYKGAALMHKPHPGGGVDIMIPPISINDMPCDWAWVFRFEGLM